jgi:hypothetical protein
MHESVLPTHEARPPGDTPATPADQPTPDRPTSLADPRVLQILMTEHWGFLATRSLAYNEAFARAGMFFTTLSASVVALALVLSAIGPGQEFQVTAIVLLGFDVLIGLATLGRVNDSSMEDLRCIQGMNRIRHAYFEVAPMIEPYLSTSPHDDMKGVLATYATGKVVLSPVEGFLHSLTTAPAMVNTVVMLLIGVLAGVIASGTGVGMAASIVVGVVAFVVSGIVSLVAADRSWRRMETDLRPRFPTVD